jgi:hypothetical protein
MIRFKSAALASAALALPFVGFALAQEEEQPKPPRQDWSFAGMFGTYDQAQLQRGLAPGRPKRCRATPARPANPAPPATRPFPN